MTIFQAAVLAIIEGLTEFLPISSTGHLILAAKILSIPDNDFLKTFEIVIQFGAILSVATIYSKKILLNLGILKKLLVAFIPTAMVGFTLYPFIKSYLLSSSVITLHALFWGGVVLILAEMYFSKNSKDVSNTTEPSYVQSFLIGIFQSFSIVPGVSRAAATILGGLFVGLNRVTATEFSFLLAIPTMFAASALDIYKSRAVISQSGTLTLLFGTAISYIFAMFAVKFLINYVKNHDFKIFGVYRILLAIAFWLLAF